MRSLKITAMCFELTISLMRSFEMLATIAPSICLDPQRAGSDLNLNRICQLVSQVFARVSTPAGVFQQVIDLCLPDLAAVTHFAIVSAVIGILLALMVDELKENDAKDAASHGSSKTLSSSHSLGPASVSRVARALLTDPSFQLAHLELALTGVQPPVAETSTPVTTQPSSAIVPKGNFDPLTRAHIDPLTNEVRVENPRTRRPDKPVVQFCLLDCDQCFTQF